ncbi:MAG: pseudouridine synthase [Actinomycetes bacterium]
MSKRRGTPSGDGRGDGRARGHGTGRGGDPRRTGDARGTRGGGPGGVRGDARAGRTRGEESRTRREAGRPATGLRARFGRSRDREAAGEERAPRRDRSGGDAVPAIGGGARGRGGAPGPARPATLRARYGRSTGRERDRDVEVELDLPDDDDDFPETRTQERDTTEVPGGVRLQKVLAQAGVASRRACEQLIGEGRVTVDGQVVRRFGARVDPARQVIHVDGKRIPTNTELKYYAFNKPIGVISTMSDPQGRPTIADYVADLPYRLFHVGRLDTETEGLILLTNDGELAHRLTHPRYGVRKKYWAKVPGPVPRKVARRLKEGVELEDGIAKVDDFRVIQVHGDLALVEIVLHEGRKHIVRRMMEEVGHRVIDLARIEFGPVKLGRLKPGTIRSLTVTEIGELYAAVGM